MTRTLKPHHKKSYSNRWVLTDERISHLNACAAQGMPLATAARELGTHAITIRNAVERAESEGRVGMEAWLAQKFPKRQGKGGGQKRKEMNSKVDGEIRRLKPEDIDAPLVVPNSPQTRWLTRAWAA